MWNRKNIEKLLRKRFPDASKEDIEDAVSNAVVCWCSSNEDIKNESAFIYTIASRELIRNYRKKTGIALKQMKNRYLQISVMTAFIIL